MIFESERRQYLNRTSKIAAREALPHGDPAHDPLDLEFRSAIEAQKERFTNEPWNDMGIMRFILSDRDGELHSSTEIEYDGVIDENMHKFLEKLLENVAPHYPEGLESFQEWLGKGLKDYRRITKMRMTSQHSTFEISKEIGKASVYTYIGNPSFDPVFGHNAQHLPQHETIIVPSDVTCLYGLYALVHEVGHGHINLNRSKSQVEEELTIRQKSRESSVSAKEKEVIIRNERTVDAYVLKNLRKFLPPDQTENLKKLLYTNLKNYDLNLRERTFWDILDQFTKTLTPSRNSSH